jgi:hypothetical protein
MEATMNELTEAMVETIKAATKKMMGANRRAFEAQATLDYLGGDPRLAETVFGWSRKTVSKGLEELRTGVVIPDQPRDAVRKTEEKNPQLAGDIRDLVEPHSQADPKFQTTFAYTRITAKAVRQALIEQKGYRPQDLPSERTICTMLNRMGYRLRRVQKTKPIKRIEETDAIFENVDRINAESDAREDSLRISIDGKAKLKIGDFSRGGVSRAREPVKALDHDFDSKKNLFPLAY